MPNVDDRIERRFRRATVGMSAPAFESIDRRRHGRLRRQRVGRGALALAVVTGSVVAFVVARTTVGDRSLPAEPGPIVIGPVEPVARENGHIAVGDGDVVLTIDPETGEIGRIPGLPAGAWDVTYSPDGERLAVQVFPDEGARELWVTDGSGTPVRVASASNVSAASWSPDGAWIAYAADTREGSAIHVVRNDGTEDRVVGPVLESRDYFSVDWSPDGTTLLFDAGTDVGYTISTMTFDGGDVRQISTGRVDYDPAWSPDGSTIAFTHQDGPMDSDIFTMAADGSHRRRLTDGSDGETNLGAVWSPDGALIAYQAGVTGGPGPVWVMNADGGDASLLADVEALGLAWQPIVSPTAEASPTAQAEPDGVDIGLETRLCDVRRLGGLDLFGDGVRGAAWTGSPVKESGRCSKAYDAPHVVAVDLDGDGLADSWADLPSCTGCAPHDATDLGGDGTLELVVLLQASSTPLYGIFDVVPEGLARGAGVYPVFVEPPGARQAGLLPQEPATLWAGGDEGFSAAIRCEGYPDATEILTAWSLFSVPDADASTNPTEEFHVTYLRLDEPDPSEAQLVVLGTESSTRPIGEDLPFDTPERTCGVDWTP